MGLVVYPRRPQEGRPELIAPHSPSARYPAFPPKGNPDRILVGMLAGVALFYLLGKAMGLGRNPTEG